MSESIVLVANDSIEPDVLRSEALQFGWDLKTVTNLPQLREIDIGDRLVCVLFDPGALGLSAKSALRKLRAICPHALTVVCHPYSEAIDWSDLAEAGAFHSLRLPFHEPEVKQTLGFVWASGRLRPRAMLAAGHAA